MPTPPYPKPKPKPVRNKYELSQDAFPHLQDEQWEQLTKAQKTLLSKLSYDFFLLEDYRDVFVAEELVKLSMVELADYRGRMHMCKLKKYHAITWITLRVSCKGDYYERNAPLVDLVPDFMHLSDGEIDDRLRICLQKFKEEKIVIRSTFSIREPN